MHAGDGNSFGSHMASIIPEYIPIEQEKGIFPGFWGVKVKVRRPLGGRLTPIFNEGIRKAEAQLKLFSPMIVKVTGWPAFTIR